MATVIPGTRSDAHVTAGLTAAARHGLAGTGVDPFTGEPVPQRSLLSRLVGRARSALDAAGDMHVVSGLLRRLDERGTGAHRQRVLWSRAATTAEFIDALAHATVAADPATATAAGFEAAGRRVAAPGTRAMGSGWR